MGERTQPNRWRCLTVGCNPVLQGESAAAAHKSDTGHRVAKWAVRSAEGKRRARQRNRSGYYDQYNVGFKARARANERWHEGDGEGVALRGEDFSLDSAGPFSA